MLGQNLVNMHQVGTVSLIQAFILFLKWLRAFTFLMDTGSALQLTDVLGTKQIGGRANYKLFADPL